MHIARFFTRNLALSVVASGTLTAVLLVGAAAQTMPPARTPIGHTANGHPHQEPCWEQAGVSKTAMEQRRSIAENTRSQVQAVCADSSLTIQQKHQKIRQIREQGRQQEEALVTPQQMEAIRSCQAQRGGHPHAGGGHMGGGEGPCGEMPMGPNNKAPSSKPEPQTDN